MIRVWKYRSKLMIEVRTHRREKNTVRCKDERKGQRRVSNDMAVQ